MNILNTQTLSNEALQSKLDQAMAKPELTAAGDLRHFIGVEGLSKTQLMAIIEKANGYLTDNVGRPAKLNSVPVGMMFSAKPGVPAMIAWRCWKWTLRWSL